MMNPEKKSNETGRRTGKRKSGLKDAGRQNIEQAIRLQRDLGLALDRASSLEETLQLCLHAAIEISGLDAGCIYMMDHGGRLNLIIHQGVTPAYVEIRKEPPADDPLTKNVFDGGQPRYLSFRDILAMQLEALSLQKVKSIAVVPFGGVSRIIGCLNVASFVYNEIPNESRYTLESIARQIGTAVARAQAGEHLKASEERYRNIFENAVEGIFQTTPDGRILSANPAMARLFGYDSPADFLQAVTNIKQIYVNPDDRLSLERDIEEKGVVTGYEIACMNHNGRPITIAINARAVRDEAGKVVRYDGSYQDVTRQKEMEKSLRLSESRYRMITENLHETIWVMDFDLQYKYYSPSNISITGFTSEEVMSMPLRQRLVPESYALVEKIMTEEFALEFSGQPVDRRRSRTMELEFYHKNGGTVWIEVSALFGRDENGKAVEILLVSRDVTEQKKVREEKEHLQKQLIQSQKLEAIGALAGGIAHDFNNILASIMGFSEMAAKESRKSTRQEYLGQVLQASERAKKLIDQILAFSRQKEQERHPVDIRLIIKEALTLLRATLPATIDMKQNIPPEETIVLADPTQIHQILMNLCTNAAQAMTGKSGRLEVILSNIYIGADRFDLYPDLQVGPYVCLSVKDTGCGIDPAIRDRIFDPFFTTKRSQEGTGLGLSVVYGIVNGYGGKIDIQSNAGEGTTFTIYLPRVLSEQEPIDARAEDINLLGNESILFVDDETMLVRMANNYFTSLGYRITATTSSSYALSLFQKNPQEFDIVVTDMTMPQITGADLSRVFLNIRPELPIILCTGYSNSLSPEEVEKLHIRELVMKPFFLHDLVAQIRKILDG